MRSFFKDVKHFITDLKFIIPLVLSVALGYGYIVSHFAVGIDDLTRQRYINGELIAQGRLSGTFISYLFGFTEYCPIWEDLASLLFIIIAAIVAAVFLKRITKDGMHPFAYTFFACFLATYPIINEIFLYGGSGLNMGIGYALTFITLMLAEDFFERKKWYTLIVCMFILAFNISMYESFVFVYVCGVCGVLLIKQLTADGRVLNISPGNQGGKQDFPFKKALTEIMWYIVPLAAGFIFEFILSNGVRSLLGISPNTTSAADVVFPPDIRSIITFSIYRFIFNGLWYLPISVLVISGVILCVMTIKNCVKCKKPVYLLYAAGMVLSILALPILQGGEIRYRTSQSLVIFCAFPLVLLLQRFLCSKVKAKRWAAVAVSLALIIMQSVSLCKWFAVDYKQSEEEMNVLCQAGDELSQKYDISKPVVFAGEYTLSDEILDYKFASKDDIRYKALDAVFGSFAQSMSAGVPSDKYGFAIAQTDHMSVITWGIDAFGEANTELLKIYSHLGYDFVQGTQSQFEDAENLAAEMKDAGQIAESGYTIVEKEEFILVAFG